jgi:LysR family transcriptional regulator, hydrogen peroxide-inducible genes activator
MTLTQLQYTLAVAEQGNFTKAAEKCFVTQPTLSMQVQKLEEELTIKLFNRTTKPISLTPIGSKVIEQAKVILNEAKRMGDVITSEKGIIGGDFRIGIIPTVMPTLLPLFLKTFIKKFPKVNLKIEELNTASIIEELKNGKLDAGIAATPLDDSKILEKPLYYEPFVGYIPENHSLSKLKSLSVEDLEKIDILVLEDGHCFREHVLKLCQTSKSLNSFNLKSGSFQTLIHLANDGMGMTLLPYLQTKSLSEKNKKNLKTFESPEPAREISMIYLKNKLKVPVIESLINIIESIMRGAIRFQNIKLITPTN